MKSLKLLSVALFVSSSLLSTSVFPVDNPFTHETSRVGDGADGPGIRSCEEINPALQTPLTEGNRLFASNCGASCGGGGSCGSSCGGGRNCGSSGRVGKCGESGVNRRRSPNTSARSTNWQVSYNQHGAVLKSGSKKIYLGKAAMSPHQRMGRDAGVQQMDESSSR